MDEQNYVLTMTVNCGECHTETPVHFDTGSRLEDVRFLYRASQKYACSGCGSKEEVSITLGQVPGGMPQQN